MKNLHQGKKEKWDQITPSTSPRARGTTEKFGNERVHHEASFQSVIRVLPELGKEHKTKPRTKKDAPAEYHGTWPKMSTSSKIRVKLRFTLRLKPGQRRRPLQNLQRNENSWLTPEQKGLSSDEMEAVRRSTNATTVVAAN